MDMMNSLDLYFNLITLVCGVYCLYTGIKLKRLGHLFPNQLLIPKDSKPEDCLDEEGFVEYITIKLLIVGVVCTLVGVICFADSQYAFSAKLFPAVEKIGYYVSQGGNVLCLAVLVWYMVCWVRSRKNFWV